MRLDWQWKLEIISNNNNNTAYQKCDTAKISFIYIKKEEIML